jgi:hypothetical protein
MNNSFEFEASPRPRSAALSVVVAPWTLTGVGAAALRCAPVIPGAVASVAVPASVVSAGAGTRGLAGPRLTMPAPVATYVRNPINRKQHVYQTRVNAGGDGASGPYPEREPV